MTFQRLGYLLSGRPYAAELRQMFARSVWDSGKARAKRVLRGRLSRDSAENRRKYNLMAGHYYGGFETEQTRLVYRRGVLTRATASEIREDNCRALIDAISATGAKSVLEVGVGDGNNLPILRRGLPDVRLAGVDIAEERIRFAREHHGGLDADFQVGSATALPFADASFDAVFSMHCLEHLPREYPAAVKEMLRVAGRRVVLVEPVPEYRGTLQQLYALIVDYMRGLPDFLLDEGIEVERAELLGAASNPFNLSTLLVLVPPRAAARSTAAAAVAPDCSPAPS